MINAPKGPKLPYFPSRVPELTPTPEQLAPRVPWDVFLRKHFEWDEGQHITIVGTTGSGKTELLKNLIEMREFAVVFATKPRDSTMDELIEYNGFKKLDKWETLNAEKHPRRVVWPDATQINSSVQQAMVFADAFARIYTEGAWNLFLDEAWMISNILGLSEQIKIYLLQARSLDISLIMATQRPVSIPVEAFDQSTWLFIFRESDERNLERIGGIAWRDSKSVRYLVANLEKYQFLAINTRTGMMWRSRVPPPKPPVADGPSSASKTWLGKEHRGPQ